MSFCCTEACFCFQTAFPDDNAHRSISREQTELTRCVRTGVAGQSQDTHGPSDVPINYLAPYVDTIKDPVRRQLAAKLSVLCVKGKA